MSTPFQNRLVGTIIIAALAIIVLPDILDGEKKTHQQEFSPIPALPVSEPAVKEIKFPNQKLEQLASEELAEDIAVDDQQVNSVVQGKQPGTGEKLGVAKQNKPVPTIKNPKVKTNTAKKPEAIVKVDKTKNQPKTLPEPVIPAQAWVVQLGSFRHQKNVKELVGKLKNNGYTVFTRPIKTKNGTLTKVFVGPELTKSALEKKLIALNKLTNVKGKVARFQPTK